MSNLPVSSAGRTHHPLRTHLLLAVHAALPVSERPQLVQVSHLLRGRSRRRPEEVGHSQEGTGHGSDDAHISLCLPLGSVVATETRQYSVGDVITMRLMCREKGSLVAMPRSQWVKVEEPIRFEGEMSMSNSEEAA